MTVTLKEVLFRALFVLWGVEAGKDSLVIVSAISVLSNERLPTLKFILTIIRWL